MAALDASGAVRLQAAGPSPSAASAAAAPRAGGGWTAQAARFGGAAALLLGAGLLLAPVATLGSVFHARRAMGSTPRTWKWCLRQSGTYRVTWDGC